MAFAAGLSVAWLSGWNTTDLVWSLWLSSLCVGYAMIVWTIFRPVIEKCTEARDHGGGVAGVAVIGGLFLAGALFLLAFFTVHFGGFHFVHSVFLNLFFPVHPGVPARGFPSLALYAEVFSRYWIWLPVAVLAERQAFVRPAGASVQLGGGVAMTAPYRNVVRMHLLIFFFAFARFVRLENFALYAAVYAVYFFPWRLVRKPRESPAQHA